MHIQFHTQFIHVQQCDYIYQNKFFKCTYVHLCLFHSKPVQHVQHSTLGMLTHNATWCQNRGCICISSVRRTYSRIHAVSCIHPSILNVQILQDRISKEEEREDPRRELQSSFQLESKSVSSVSTRNPAFYKNYPVIPCKENYSTYKINSSTRNLQEILQLQGSSCAHR